MNRLFTLDNPVSRFLERVFDLIYLNILCLVCCIPIITIGSSVTALYYCMIKIKRERDSYITKMFFQSFKTNLKQGILMTILFIGLAVFLLFDIHICNSFNLAYKEYIKVALYILLEIFAIVISYAFPILAQFDSTIRQNLKISLIMAIGNLGCTIFILVLNALPFVLYLFFTEIFWTTFPIWITLGFSFIAMVNTQMFVKIFAKYIPENEEW